MPAWGEWGGRRAGQALEPCTLLSPAQAASECQLELLLVSAEERNSGQAERPCRMAARGQVYQGRSHGSGPRLLQGFVCCLFSEAPGKGVSKQLKIKPAGQRPLPPQQQRGDCPSPGPALPRSTPAPPLPPLEPGAAPTVTRGKLGARNGPALPPLSRHEQRPYATLMFENPRTSIAA